MLGCKICCHFQRRAGLCWLFPACTRMSGHCCGWIDDDVNQYLRILCTEMFWDGIKRASCRGSRSKISDLRGSHKYRPDILNREQMVFHFALPHAGHWDEESGLIRPVRNPTVNGKPRSDGTRLIVLVSADATGHVPMGETDWRATTPNSKVQFQ